MRVKPIEFNEDKQVIEFEITMTMNLLMITCLIWAYCIIIWGITYRARGKVFNKEFMA